MMPASRLLVIAVGLSFLAIAACARPVVTEERFTQVPIAVSVGCVAEGGRPGSVTPLREAIAPEAWRARAPGAKAEAIRAQAGRRMNHTDELAAATAGCR